MKGQETVAQLAARYEVHPGQMQARPDPSVEESSSRSESEYCLTGAAGKPRSLDVNHSCRSSMVSHRCSLNPVTFSTGLGTLGACG